ncbi:hypothetical protein Poli38472_006549 [Pythium oligandrum]|uniref:t-SNARE coiled-coil homology domain-containing protein n=1 Tax=Pythium oligandrum TaxID=41045 RepID=A0A8K1C4Z3_PYTOL|nr:hypothetical protein Poli38472_006549 [Pythium oligandrum]|eukprot:TMW56539.1 hypothetical protein Poli38472_006549 [Pythium oligandrum]
MGDRYHAADSPRDVPDERFRKLVQETSKGISSFNQLTRSMAQKLSLFGTPQDSRSNHQQLKELSEKGNKLVTKINRRLQEMNKACTGPQGRARKTQVTKLSSDFKTQVKQFEETCSRLIESERHSVDLIRRSSQSFRRSDESFNAGGGGGGGNKGNQNNGNGFVLSNYDEDQLYAQANVTYYDEDDLARREEDIIHINHQLREVNAAFVEIDGLVQDQGETIIEIEQNTEEAADNASKALEQVQQADARKSYCICTKWKMMGFGVLAIIILVVILALAKAG